MIPASRMLQEVYSKNFLGLRSIHHKLTCSSFIARIVFGQKFIFPPLKALGATYFDLTSILMYRHLKQIVLKHPEYKILEIGVGGYATVSGPLSHFLVHPIDAVDIQPELVDSAKAHVSLNDQSVVIHQSNAFDELAPKKYDLIFWNLPYCDDQAGYLPSFFFKLSEFVKPGAKVVLGYNEARLSPLVFDDYLKSSGFHRDYVKSWSWNNHEILAIKKQESGL